MTSALRDEIRATVKEIVLSIKPLDQGLDDFPDDAPLFDLDPAEPSPIKLDSLDSLDLALAIGERFDIDREEIDRMFAGETDLRSLRTVNDIAEFIISVTSKADSVPTGATKPAGSA